MREEVSITLPSEVLAGIDHLDYPKHSRSSFIERVLRIYFRDRTRGRVYARDLKRINAAADRLNNEANEILSYQASKH
jgi:metal-responsive CopG/Arc/MetJ family transcriptional regulator